MIEISDDETEAEEEVFETPRPKNIQSKKSQGKRQKKKSDVVMIIENDEEILPPRKEEPKPLANMEIEMEFLSMMNAKPPAKKGRKKKTSAKKVSVTKALLIGKETPKPIAFRTRNKTKK